MCNLKREDFNMKTAFYVEYEGGQVEQAEIVAKIKQKRSNNELIGKLLTSYNVGKVSELKPSQYEAFLTDISQI